MSSAHYAIRQAASDDLAEVSSLLRETWHATYDEIIGNARVDELSSAWHCEARLAKELSDPRNFLTVVVLPTGIAAFASMQQDSNVAYLRRLYVRPAQQRQGIGKALLASLVSKLTGVSVIRLEVLAANQLALSFYEQHGFCRVSETADCFRDGSMIAELILERPVPTTEPSP